MASSSSSCSRDNKAVMLTKDSVSLLPCFYFVELPILVSCVVVLYFLEWTDVFSPVRAGFSCHDRALSLPYVDPHHEVIPLMMLLSLAFAGPAITIMIGEAILFCCLSRRRTGPGAEANINAAGCNFNSFIRRAVRFVGVHAFGLCATALITDVLQLMTGYPAPYFLTVCKPDYGTRNVTCEQSPYVLDDICAGPDPAAINQGRKSFPSQHATLASFAAVYVSMYFNSTLTDSSKLLKPLLVFSFVICAIICGLTRIIQYKNHAMDVYLGFILGGAIAIYLGLYAVGNFQPSEEGTTGVPPPPRGVHCPPCSLPHISQEAVLHHLQMKAMAGNHHHHQQGLPASYSDGLLHRALQQQQQQVSGGGGGDTLKRSSADVDVMSPRSPLGKDPMVTFSHTLPRVHTPQAMAAYEEAARRHAATLHHGSMDSSRSKQLLSQWKKSSSQDQGHRKCSLQVPADSFSSSVDSSSGQSSLLLQQQNPHHHGSMELLRTGSEPPPGSSAHMGGLLLNGGGGGGGGGCYGDPSGGGGGGAQSYLAKLAAGASATLPGNCSSSSSSTSGIAGGGRVMQAAAMMAMQSRPGSSQLVHIPEEAHENYNHLHHLHQYHHHQAAAGASLGSPRTTGGGGEATMAANSAAAAAAAAAQAAAQANWQRAAEATAGLQAYRTSGDGGQPQPRVMQVIAMSKQQGLLQTHSKSLDEGSLGCGGGGGCGAAEPRYRGLGLDHQDLQPPCGGGGGGGGAATMDHSISGSTGAIVRVEAHPENNGSSSNNHHHHHRPVIQPPSAQDGGSWRWRSLDHGTAGGGGGGGGAKQSFELNDLNRDSESSESTATTARDSGGSGSVDRKRANRANATGATASPTVTVHTQNTGQHHGGELRQQQQHPPTPQGLSTIRVTPGDGGGGGGGVSPGPVPGAAVAEGGCGGSEVLPPSSSSTASSRESTLRRKANSSNTNIILIPERASSPDSARNIFYKGTSMSHTFRE